MIELSIPNELIVERMSGRRIHEPSGRSYHVVFNPPRVPERDDETGEPLIQRTDDQEDTVRDRLKVYHRQTAPLVQYYRERLGSYFVIDGTGSVEEISDSISAALRTVSSH